MTGEEGKSDHGLPLITTSSANLSSETADSETESRRASNSSTLYAGAMIGSPSRPVSTRWLSISLSESGTTGDQESGVSPKDQDVNGVMRIS